MRLMSAITTILRRSARCGYFPPFSSGKNFWIVVNTTPPLATCSNWRKCSLPSACTGFCRRSAAQREKRAEKLVVQIVAVGQDHDGRILHRRMLNDFPGVKHHRKAFAASLRVPDHPRPLVPALPDTSTVLLTALLTAWKLMIRRNLLPVTFSPSSSNTTKFRIKSSKRALSKTPFSIVSSCNEPGRHQLLARNRPPRHEPLPIRQRRAQPALHTRPKSPARHLNGKAKEFVLDKFAVD